MDPSSDRRRSSYTDTPTSDSAHPATHTRTSLLSNANEPNTNLPGRHMRMDRSQTQFATDRRLTARRNTGSTLAHTSFVSCGLECSSNRCVTAVDTPRWARSEAKVLRRTWNVRLGNLTCSRIRSHVFGLNRSGDNLSCSSAMCTRRVRRSSNGPAFHFLPARCEACAWVAGRSPLWPHNPAVDLPSTNWRDGHWL